ncbi:MAG: T9SS type A sorting domain-containing protein [Crocinitomicaceae bacterium]|nr:T9SS type A sorting domain-containing protein [Crocinitomicaceae bacterium]
MIRILGFIFFLLISSETFTQINFKALPKSFSMPELDYSTLPMHQGEAIDVDALFQEDELSESPWMRSGITKPVNLSLEETGEWMDLDEGGRIWIMRFQAPNAVATSLYMENVSIPAGAYLNIYTPDKQFLRGAFDAQSFGERGRFTHDDLPGEELILELYEPESVEGQTHFTIASLCYMYVMPQHLLKASGSCNVDVNCSEGTNFEDQKKAVVRIKTYKGGWVGWCSGKLMNNTNQDCRPMILTAWHCGLGNGFSDPTQNDLDNYIFYFNYQLSDCGSGTAQNDQVLGCSMLGNSQDGGGDNGSDFMLVELNSAIPWSYDVFYAGWDANNSASSSGVTMHHPSGDYKKISTYTSPTISDAFGTATGSHWRVSWVATANGHGVTEGGSSGCPLFNAQGNVIGQLTGGGASCSSPTSPDLYGKMAYNWNSNTGVGGDALQTLLDPSNTGVMTFYGTYPPCVAGVVDHKNGLEKIQVYPNPGKDVVTLYSPDVTSYELKIYSISGKEVWNEKVYKEEKKLLLLQDFSAGMYIIQIVSKGSQITQKLIVE